MRRRGLNNSGSLIIPTTGLVSHYKFDETTGDAIDSVGGHNGTCFNVIRPGVSVVGGQAAGVVGNSYGFNGTSSSIEIPDTDDHSFVGVSSDMPFSISMWINRDTVADFVALARRSTGQEWQVVHVNSILYLELYSQGATANRFSVGASIDLRKWKHFVFRYNGNGAPSGMQVLVNNTFPAQAVRSSGTYVKMSNTASTTIFGTFQKTSLFTKGLMDEVRIYKNHYLTDEEVAALFSEGNRAEVIAA